MSLSHRRHHADEPDRRRRSPDRDLHRSNLDHDDSDRRDHKSEKRERDRDERRHHHHREAKNRTPEKEEEEEEVEEGQISENPERHRDDRGHHRGKNRSREDGESDGERRRESRDKNRSREDEDSDGGEKRRERREKKRSREEEESDGGEGRRRHRGNNRSREDEESDGGERRRERRKKNRSQEDEESDGGERRREPREKNRSREDEESDGGERRRERREKNRSRDDEESDDGERRREHRFLDRSSKEDIKQKDKPSAPVQQLPDAPAIRTGGIYIPPHRLAQMMAEVSDKASDQYQRLSWDALRKSINGLVNKVNATNIKNIVPELFAENLIRGRGLFCRSCMKSQMASPGFTDVFAALVAVVNTKFPEVGKLLLRRIVLQLKRAYKRNDKPQLLAATKFIAHLVNQQVAHEIIALELLTVLLENPTDDSVEVAVGFVKECGALLQDFSPQGLHVLTALKLSRHI